MGKIRQLGNLLLRRDVLLRLGGIAAAVIGAVSAVFGIAGAHVDWIYVGIFGLVILLLAATFVVYEMYEPPVSVDDIFGTGLPTQLHCPCSTNLADRARELGRHYFGANIDSNIYELLRMKNQLILACLTDRHGELLGYFDAIPVTESFALSFLKGDVSEVQLTHEVVLPVKDMPTCKYLYLAGIAVTNSRTPAGKQNARILIWAFLRYLRKFYGAAQPFGFALAATTEGDKLLRNVGMTLENDGSKRIDHYKLYTGLVTREALEKQLAMLEGYNAQCTLGWPDSKRSTPRTKPRPRAGRGRQEQSPAQILPSARRASDDESSKASI